MTAAQLRGGASSEDVSRNLLRAQSAASRVPPKILTHVQVCSGFRLPPLLAAWAPRDDFWTHLAAIVIGLALGKGGLLAPIELEGVRRWVTNLRSRKSDRRSRTRRARIREGPPSQRRPVCQLLVLGRRPNSRVRGVRVEVRNSLLDAGVGLHLSPRPLRPPRDENGGCQ